VSADSVEVRDATLDERAWANRVYASVDFEPSPAETVQLVAIVGGAIVGLGRLGAVGGGAVELGGMWTAESARGTGVAAAMVRALLARAGAADVWCVPFRPLVDYYARFGFAEVPPSAAPWPPGIAHKVARCAEHGQAIAIMRLP